MKAYVTREPNGPRKRWWRVRTVPDRFHVSYLVPDEEDTPERMALFLDNQARLIREFLHAESNFDNEVQAHERREDRE